MKKTTSLLLVFLLLLGLMTGCAEKPAEPAPAPAPEAVEEEKPAESAPAPAEEPEKVPAEEEAPATRIITDMAGREVEIPTDVQSVAAL